MIRLAIASLMLAGSALMALEPAYSQVVQYQYTPPPPVVPLNPGLAPLQVTPSVRPLDSQSPGLVQVPGRPPVVVPPSAREGTYSDRIKGCIHAGAGAGVGPNDLGPFSAQCAN